MRVRMNNSIKGTIMEYTVLFDREDRKELYEDPYNEIVLRLYSVKSENGNIIYYNAGVGFNIEGAPINFRLDECPNKIIIGIDKMHFSDQQYIGSLIAFLLNKKDFTSKNIDLEKGLYRMRGNEFKSGRYVGELKVNHEGEYLKSFDPKFGEQIYLEDKPERERRERRENSNREFRELTNDYYQKYVSLQRDFEREYINIAKKYGIPVESVNIPDVANSRSQK